LLSRSPIALAAALLLTALLAPMSVADIPADGGTLALFSFDGDVLDSSGNGRDAVLLGGSFVPTARGQGLRVGPGQPAGISWSAHAAQLAHPYTVEMIVNASDTSSYRKLFSFHDGADAGWYLSGGGFQAYPHPVLGQGTLAPSREHYLAIVSLSPTQVEVYANGVRLGATPAAFTAPPPQAIFFRDDTQTSRSEQLNGIVEALRISSVARTAEEIGRVQCARSDVTQPEVALDAPAAGRAYVLGAETASDLPATLVAGPVTLAASASDDCGIASVEFLVDGVSIGIATSAPYEATWTPPAPGEYLLQVVALDLAGLAADDARAVVALA